jgi:hypothetical protein
VVTWSAVIWVTDGVRVPIGGIVVTSTDPIRPLIAGALLTAVYVFASGRARLREDARHAAEIATPSRLAALLAIVIGIIAIWQSSWTASGADAYAYVTQADSWLAGSLKVPVPIADEVPWPKPLATFVPFGYSAVANESAIASAVGPGLPLLMALLKAVGGHQALFLVVPITAALLIWSIFAIGRHVGSASIGLGAAWLAATSPAFLTMVKEPMSDVPAAAFWAFATWKVLDSSRLSAVLGGVAAAIAILVRPNLVPLAAVLGGWVLWPRVDERVRDRARPFGVFSLPVVLACMTIAWINQILYASPLASGYGAAETLFSVGNAWTNVRRYGGWLVETQTPLAVAGFLALLVPHSKIWPTVEARGGAALLAAIAAVTVIIYAFYIPFDAWWFLRLLLPAWPALSIGTASLITAGVSWLASPWSRASQAAALLALGLYTSAIASRLQVFPDNEGERRYATIAQLVAQATEPTAIILASIHAGPLRYYAGRDTMRFDLLDEAWLDRAVTWLTEHGRRPYVLIEDWERPIFERRFAAMNSLGRLELSPVLAYRAYGIPGTVYLFDPTKHSAPTLEPAPIRNPQPRCPLPAPPPALALQVIPIDPTVPLR